MTVGGVRNDNMPVISRSVSDEKSFCYSKGAQAQPVIPKEFLRLRNLKTVAH